MSKCPSGLAAILEAIRRSPQRSSLFYWLHEHHDAVIEAAAGKPIRWAPLCTRFAELGLTDRTGKPASEAIARKTWHGVRRLVAKERAAPVTSQAAAPSAPRHVMPSKLPLTRQPSVAATNRDGWTTEAVLASQQGPKNGAGGASNALADLTAEEKVERLRKKLRDRNY
jgi:hypothetical protein